MTLSTPAVGRPSTAILLGLVALAPACGGDRPAAGPADAVPTWTVEQVARIGSVEGPHTNLADVADVLAIGGEVLVLEWGQPRIARFGPDHEWLEDFAAPGDGPGELRSPQAIGRTGRSLWVHDPRGARLETYSLDGEPEASFRFTIPGDSLAVAMSALAPLADGTLLAGPSTRPIGGQLRGALRYADYARVDSGGQVLERLYRAEFGSGDAFAADVGGGRQIIGLHPIQQSPLVRPFPDGSGLVVVERDIAPGPDQHTFRLVVLDVDGAATVDRRISYTPVPADGWRERHIQRLLRSAQGSEMPPSMVQGLREGLPDRAFHPPVSELVAGADGTVWLRREPLDTAEATWEVYDRQGTPVGRVTLPAELRLGHASRQVVWGVETDELDVPYVVGLRLRP